jgi:hypothetical protein
MENQYLIDEPIERSGEKKYFGLHEQVAGTFGVFAFYMLVFFAISILSSGFTH